MTGRAAVFIDRDGTLIEDRDYLSDPSGVVLLPGVGEALSTLRSAGLTLVVVTNQSGIARGLYTLEEYHAVAARLDEMLAVGDAAVDATYFCPHHPEWSGPCECRKPGTGMHRQAAEALGIDLASSFYVGDKLADVAPAAILGGQGILVRTGYGADFESEVPAGVVVVDDFPAAARQVLEEHAPNR